MLVDCANFTNTTNVNDESCTGTVGELQVSHHELMSSRMPKSKPVDVKMPKLFSAAVNEVMYEFWPELLGVLLSLNKTVRK